MERRCEDDHLDLLLEVKDRYVKAPYPAWTGVGVTDRANPHALIEIDVIAESRRQPLRNWAYISAVRCGVP